MKIYIKSSGIISPQPTIEKGYFFEKVLSSNSNYLRSFEPDYKNFINPMMLRKMPRIIKMGLGASKICLENAGIENPDAIITGTGHGCMEDLEKFMLSVYNSHEQVLSPTSFILSSHNMVASQIALVLKNHGYNMNYCHRGFSFERALEDGIMLLDENKAENVLVGGIDENTDNYFLIHEQIDRWKKEKINNLALFNHKTPGTIAGEGAAFFVISKSSENKNLPFIRLSSTLYKPDGFEEIQNSLNNHIQTSGINIKDIDLAILGKNGDIKFDGIYDELIEKWIPPETTIAYYKHLCGEYHTAVSFALGLACNILVHQQVPEICLTEKKQRSPIKNILIYNHYRHINHSCILLSLD